MKKIIYETGVNARAYKHGQCTHNGNSRLYAVHSGMMARCYNLNEKSFKNYGGRGISVCDEWHNKSVFFKWALSHGYSDDLTIDRIENNGNYCPENCQFITRRDNNLKRPKSADHGVYYRKDKGNRYIVVLYKRINGIDTAFYGGHYFTTKEDALKVRDELYEKIKNLQ